MKRLPILLAVLFLAGCCMKSVNVKPQVSGLDLKTMAGLSGNIDIAIPMKECCPSKSQKAILATFQQTQQDLLARLIANDPVLGATDDARRAQYNSLVAATNAAIANWVVACRTDAVSGEAPRGMRVSAAQALVSVAEAVQKVKDQLSGRQRL